MSTEQGFREQIAGLNDALRRCQHIRQKRLTEYGNYRRKHENEMRQIKDKHTKEIIKYQRQASLLIDKLRKWKQFFESAMEAKRENDRLLAENIRLQNALEVAGIVPDDSAQIG